MTLQEAAQSISNHINFAPWFVSVGTADSENEPKIFLYVKKSARKADLQPYINGWEGYKVEISRYGQFLPCS